MMDQATPENELSEEESLNLVYAFSAGNPFHPGESGTAFAGRSSGLLRSSDGGQTWEDALTSLELREPLPVTCVITPPHAGSAGGAHVIAGAPGGVVRSVDNGQTWRAVVFHAPPPTVSALAVSPNYGEDQTIFAGTVEDGVFISIDSGLSWVGWNFGFLDLNVLCLAVSPDFTQDETIFAGTETGIFRSTNGGRAWREVEMPFGYSAVLALAYAPDFAHNGTLYAATEDQGVWVSTDRGESWALLCAFDEPANAILVFGSEIVVATGSGLHHSTDQGHNWHIRCASPDDEREITAVLALQGMAPATKILIGYMSGEIETVTLPPA